MTYKISYQDEVPISVRKWRNDEAARTETFGSEAEALRRARELIDDGEHQRVVVSDASGNALGGIRLQLKLGLFGE
jgi:hypothetical protein